MIEIKELGKTYFPLYDNVSQNVEIKSEYHVKRIDSGLGGFIFEEVSVTPHIKDLSIYES